MDIFPNIEKTVPEFNVLEDDHFKKKNISVNVLRLDKIHPVVSGNKLFKLYYYLQEAKMSGKKIVTYGGPWSNHLAATAFACKMNNIPCIGIVRGEQPPAVSATLKFCEQQGMKIEFISRKEF